MSIYFKEMNIYRYVCISIHLRMKKLILLPELFFCRIWLYVFNKRTLSLTTRTHTGLHWSSDQKASLGIPETVVQGKQWEFGLRWSHLSTEGVIVFGQEWWTEVILELSWDFPFILSSDLQKDFVHSRSNPAQDCDNQGPESQKIRMASDHLELIPQTCYLVSKLTLRKDSSSCHLPQWNKPT